MTNTENIFSGGIIGVVALPVLLPAAGFTGAGSLLNNLHESHIFLFQQNYIGVAAGSIAAGIQSVVYGGATTGVFRYLTSTLSEFETLNDATFISQN